MNTQLGLLSFTKAFLSKAIFSVGLCTVGYFTVSQWEARKEPSAGTAAAIRSQEESQSLASGLNSPDSIGAGAPSQFQVISHSVPAVTPVESPSVTDSSNANTSEVASAQPSASPNASETPADAAASGEAVVQAYDQGVLPIAQPFSIWPPSEESAQVTPPQTNDSQNSGVWTPPGPQQGGMPARPSAGGGRVGGGVFVGVDPNQSATSNLTEQDTRTLFATVVRASVQAQQIPVTGKNSDGSDLAAPNNTVSSNRWNWNMGLKPEVNFVIRPSGSQSAPVLMDVQLQILTHNEGVEYPLSLQLRPQNSQAQSEVRDGKAVRVMTFQFAEQNVSVNGTSESLKNIQLQLVYDLSTGAPQLNEGSLSWVRNQVKISSLAWDPSRVPASDNTWFVADQVPLSIRLEKSK